jgi:hypothetical protein
MKNLTIKEEKDLKESLQLEPDFEASTRILAVAVAAEDYLNEHLCIPTIAGTPICQEIHDLVRDCYYVRGVGWHDLGEIPVGFRVTMSNISGWMMEMPIPSEMLDQYLNAAQKNDFESWKGQYDDKGYEVQYLQLRSVY